MNAHEEFSTAKNTFVFKNRNDDYQVVEHDAKCTS